MRYLFHLSDAAALDVIVSPDGVEVGNNVHGDASTIDLLVSCDANTYLLLAYGRLDLDAAHRGRPVQHRAGVGGTAAAVRGVDGGVLGGD